MSKIKLRSNYGRNLRKLLVITGVIMRKLLVITGVIRKGDKNVWKNKRGEADK